MADIERCLFNEDKPKIRANQGYSINKMQLSTLKPKDTFKIGNEEFIVLEQTDTCTKVVSKQFAHTDRNNWKAYINRINNKEWFCNGIYVIKENLEKIQK